MAAYITLRGDATFDGGDTPLRVTNRRRSQWLTRPNFPHYLPPVA
jgi:hypothetical protein